MASEVCLWVNGEEKRVPSGLSVRQLLDWLGISGLVAVERNGEVVPRASHSDTFFEANDRLEIVHFVGGG